MKIVWREMYDHEWLGVRLHSESDLSDKEIMTIKQFLGVWLEAQVRALHYSGPRPRIELEDASNSRVLRLRFEWLPQDWFEPLARALEAKVSSLWLLEMGEDFEVAYRDDKAFIDVCQRLVDFEDGSRMEVQPFRIAKYPVSIAQFRRFGLKTGYKTTAEQRNSDNTFYDNIFISDIPLGKRDPLPALCVSYLDAASYCDWARARLPTEAEWLAAAVIDDTICEEHQYYQLRSTLRERANALIIDYREITGTVVDGRLAVLRARPYLIRTRGDLTRLKNRRLVSLTFCQEHVEFRVCQ
jgi:hypothetical protein